MKLIDKDALVAEINRLIAELVKEGEGTMFEQGRISAFEDAKLFLDTLEVKDLQEEPVSIWHDASEKSNEPEEVDNPCKIRKNLQKDIVIVLNGQRHRQVLDKGCSSKKECKEKCSLYGRCQKCCIDLCMIFFHDPHCHFVEEPVSAELEEAAIYYADTHTEWFDSDGNPHVSPAFKSGAEWQKDQDKETIELAEDHAMLAGIIKGTEHTIGNVRSILNKVAYENNGLDVNGDYCQQPYIELDNEIKKLLKEDLL